MAQSGLEFAEIARHPIFEDIDITPWTVRRHALGENFSCGDRACDSDVQPVKAPKGTSIEMKRRRGKHKERRLRLKTPVEKAIDAVLP